jgi:hypothetical protein
MITSVPPAINSFTYEIVCATLCQNHVFGIDKFRGYLIIIKGITLLHKEICFKAFPTGYFKNQDKYICFTFSKRTFV